nr:CdaR family protein [Deinobacterium chartae]
MPSGEGRRTVSDITETVRITLEGTRTRLDQVQPDRIEATLDVTGLPEGPFQRRVQVEAPADTRLVRYNPEQASGFIDAVVSQSFAVRLAVTEVPTNELVRLTVSPRVVTVTGAQRQVGGIASVVTAPETIEPGTSREVALIPLDSNGRAVTDVALRPQRVTVSRVDVGEILVREVSVQLSPQTGDWDVRSVRFTPARVRLTGSVSALRNLTTVQATVPLRAGSYSAPATLNLPAGVVSLDNVTADLVVRPQQP